MQEVYDSGSVWMVNLFEMQYHRVMFIDLDLFTDQLMNGNRNDLWARRVKELKAKYRWGLMDMELASEKEIVDAAYLLGVELPDDRLACVEFLDACVRRV